MAARVARPVLGIIDDAGEQTAGLLAVVGLRLRHQPLGVEAASGRIVSAFHRALECDAGAGKATPEQKIGGSIHCGGDNSRAIP